jgi:hypothetical protein
MDPAAAQAVEEGKSRRQWQVLQHFIVVVQPYFDVLAPAERAGSHVLCCQAPLGIVLWHVMAPAQQAALHRNVCAGLANCPLQWCCGTSLHAPWAVRCHRPHPADCFGLSSRVLLRLQCCACHPCICRDKSLVAAVHTINHFTASLVMRRQQLRQMSSWVAVSDSSQPAPAVCTAVFCCACSDQPADTMG